MGGTRLAGFDAVGWTGLGALEAGRGCCCGTAATGAPAGGCAKACRGAAAGGVTAGGVTAGDGPAGRPGPEEAAGSCCCSKLPEAEVGEDAGESAPKRTSWPSPQSSSDPMPSLGCASARCLARRSFWVETPGPAPRLVGSRAATAMACAAVKVFLVRTSPTETPCWLDATGARMALHKNGGLTKPSFQRILKIVPYPTRSHLRVFIRVVLGSLLSRQVSRRIMAHIPLI